MSIKWISLIPFLIISIPFLVNANDCGVIGEIYPINEPDLLRTIQAQLSRFQEDGNWNQLNERWQQQLQKEMDRPKPVAGLMRALQSRTWIFNPSIQIPFDLKTDDGRVLVPAGSVINPLKSLILPNTLLFYNADDSEQVNWAYEEDQKLKGQDKLILVGGSVGSQILKFHKHIFFDQGGLLTYRFKLQFVPSLVRQKADRLEIEEVKP